MHWEQSHTGAAGGVSGRQCRLAAPGVARRGCVGGRVHVRTPAGAAREHASVSLAEIAEDALADRRDAIAEKAILLEATIAPIRLAGSETLLRRMVDNVIENAAL
jgi:signal transduction histidine kinase